MTRSLLAAAILAFTAAAPLAQAAVVINYNNFSGACGDGTLTCVGSATSPAPICA